MKPLILVVDDEETQRKMLQKILIREGYNVEIAAGVEAERRQDTSLAAARHGLGLACQHPAIAPDAHRAAGGRGIERQKGHRKGYGRCVHVFTLVLLFGSFACWLYTLR